MCLLGTGNNAWYASLASIKAWRARATVRGVRQEHISRETAVRYAAHVFLVNIRLGLACPPTAPVHCVSKEPTRMAQTLVFALPVELENMGPP